MRTPGDSDTALLHFSAGPPYEDIAFRIVDREWEYSHKRYIHLIVALCSLTFRFRGFRSSFDRGCLSLWFNFRRNVRELVMRDTCFLTHNPSSIANESLSLRFHFSNLSTTYTICMHTISTTKDKKRCWMVFCTRGCSTDQLHL